MINFRAFDIRSFLKKMTISVVMMLSCVLSWGATYYWMDISADGDGNYWWNTETNWVTDPVTKTGNPTPGVGPTAADSIIFDASYFTTLPSPIEIVEMNVAGITVGTGVTISCKSVTTNSADSTITGSLTTTNDITFGGRATISSNLNAGGDLTFNDTATLSADLTAGGDISFNGDVTYTGGHPVIPGTGKTIKLNCSSFNNNSTIRFLGNVENNQSIAFGKDIIISGNLTDSGGITSGNTITFNGDSSSVTLDSSTVNSKIVVFKNAGAGISFLSDVTASTFTITSASSISFAGSFSVSSLIFNGTIPADITFPRDCSITTCPDFGNTGTLTFGSSSGDTISLPQLKHTGSSTVINGTLSTSGNIDVKSTVINGTAETTGTFTSGSKVSIGGAGKLQASGKITVSSGGIENSGIITALDESVITGAFTSSGTVSITGKLTQNGNVTVSSGSFSAGECSITGSLSNAGTFSATGTTTVSSDLTNNGTFTAAALTVSGKITNQSGKTFNSNGKVTVKADFSDSGTWNDGASGEILIDGSRNQTFAAGSSTYKKITENKSSGNLTFTNNLNATDIVIQDGNTTTFSGIVNAGNLTISDGKTNLFNGNATITTLDITKTDSITFAGLASINSYTDSPTTTGTVSFKGGGSITNAVVFNTSGMLTFGDDGGDSFSIGSTSPYAALTHTRGNTTVNGTLNAADVSFGIVTATATINSKDFTSTNLTLTGTLNGADISIGKGNLTGDINGSSLEVTDASGITARLNGTVSTTGNQVYNGEVVLTGAVSANCSASSANLDFKKKISGAHKLTAGAGSSSGVITFHEIDIDELIIENGSQIKIYNNVITAKNLNIPHPVMVCGSGVEIQTNVITVSGTPSPSFSGDTVGGVSELTVTGYFVNNVSSSINDLKISVNKGFLCKNDISTTANGELEVSQDFVVTGSSTIGIPVTARNIVLYSGTFTAQENLTAKEDLVLFGANYTVDDSQSGVADVYAYNSTYGVMANHKYTATTLPDETSLPAPSTYSGVLSCSSGITVKATENFYANGITASSTGNWNLKLKSNKNVITNFAYAIACDFSGSKVLISSYETGAATDGIRIACEEMTPASVDSVTDSAGWDLDNFIIKENTSTDDFVYTIDDDVVCLEFTYAPRNAAGELNTNITRVTNSTGSYTGLYTDWTCSTVFANNAVDGTKLYIKSADTWNTDATGTSAGQSDSNGNYKSTDADGNIKNVVPYLSIPRNDSTYCYFITDLWGRRLRHYSGAGTYGNYTDVRDRTGPVLYSVRTGQENHVTNPANQKDYDGHNFIEFRYSERVDFGDSNPAVCDINLPYSSYTTAENIAVTDMFGAVAGDVTAAGVITLKGLGTIADGQLYTGKAGSPDKYVNALYRVDEYSIRIGIAALTNGTITYDGKAYKNWEGYIESAVQPSGTVTLPGAGINNLVKDWQGNLQKMCKPSGLSVNSSIEGVYSGWDIEEPEFAVMKMAGPSLGLEAVGNGSGSALNRIEVHVFDNKGENSIYAPTASWYTERGWVTDGTDNLYIGDSYCADIFGGARPFISDTANRTSGGLRICTLYDQYTAFHYGVGENSAASTGFNSMTVGSESSVFTGASSPRRNVPVTADSLYFKLGFSQTGLHVKTTFTLSYDSSNSYVTDLAGNRLRGKTGNTIDRTSPSFNITVSPLEQNKMVLTFSKAIRFGGIVYNGNVIPESFEQIIPYCFEIGTIDGTGVFTANTGSDLQVEKSIPAQILNERNNSNYSCFTLTLNRNVTLDDVKNCFIRIKNAGAVGGNVYDETSNDPVTDLANCYVTFIQDSIGNYLQFHEAHSLSDFIVNGVTALYAYEPDLKYDGKNIFDGLYENESWAVHNFNRDQQNYGSLPQGYGVNIVTSSDVMKNLRLYYSSAPVSGSQASKFNSNYNTDFRIWLPEAGNHFGSFAYNPNYNSEYVDGDKNLLFQIPESAAKKWQSGQTLSFLFGLLDDDKNNVTIVHTPYLNSDYLTYDLDEARSIRYPLFVIRLTNPADLLSLDLWSIKIRSIKNQRGGVTILNNVINVSKGEKTVLKLNAESEGNITVTVMTLDGNIVKYLNRGRTSAGEHYFTWDGTNKSGMTVARGMYFIRVSGNDIDETRKVMVVK